MYDTKENTDLKKYMLNYKNYTVFSSFSKILIGVSMIHKQILKL